MGGRQPSLIGIDWGTSSLRAYLFDAQGAVLATRSSARGVMTIGDGDFAGALASTTADWSAAGDVPLIACGMVGSVDGWVAAPYCPCPAGVPEIAAALVVATSGAVRCHVVPGVRQDGGAPDVMRGEETQVAGVLQCFPAFARGRLSIVLPGTHAKWVTVEDGVIVALRTFITGELFALLRDHSTLGRPAQRAAAQPPPPQERLDTAFDRGVAAAQAEPMRGLAPHLFSTRALVLADELSPGESLAYLSGLLIGDEVATASTECAPELVLAGEPALCERYARALGAVGRTGVPSASDAAPAGLWRIAREAGIIESHRHAGYTT